MSALVVVLDADVLFGRTLRDMLLYAAAEGLFQPRWSTETLDELRRNLVEKGKLTLEQAEGLLELLREAFDEAEVDGYEAQLEEVSNHPKDRHVAAAALHEEATIIVTKNLPDFTPEPDGVIVESPDEFLTRLLRLDRARLLGVIRFLETYYRQPPLTLEEVLDTLSRDAPQFVTRVRSLLGAP